MGAKPKIGLFKKFGLIGRTLSYSFSKSYFSNKFKSLDLSQYSYENFEFPDEATLADFLLEEVYILNGFNVTIPYKEKILPYLDKLQKNAKAIQAVNTVLVKNNKLIGYNTDVYGFLESLKSLLKKHHKKALLLGTGGASKSIAYALHSIGIDFTLVSRNPKNVNDIRYKDIDEKLMKSHQIIINCTPVGTFPELDVCPDIPYQFLNSIHLVYDLVYNPEKTLFLEKAKNKGASIQSGLQMLQLQAEKSWEIWNS